MRIHNTKRCLEGRTGKSGSPDSFDSGAAPRRSSCQFSQIAAAHRERIVAPYGHLLFTFMVFWFWTCEGGFVVGLRIWTVFLAFLRNCAAALVGDLGPITYVEWHT